MKQQRRMNIPMCLAGILFCLTLISIHLTSGLYAKYTTQSSSEDTARVAKFEVTETATSFSNNFEIPMTPGTLSKTITIENKSEVAIRYEITVENRTGNLPLDIYVLRAQDTVESSTTNSWKSDIAVGETENITMQIQWEKEGALAYMGMVDVLRISLEAEQID